MNPATCSCFGDDTVEQAHEEAEGELERVLDAARGAAFPPPEAPATATKTA